MFCKDLSLAKSVSKIDTFLIWNANILAPLEAGTSYLVLFSSITKSCRTW